jgi:hypothetical protein
MSSSSHGTACQLDQAVAGVQEQHHTSSCSTNSCRTDEVGCIGRPDQWAFILDFTARRRPSSNAKPARGSLSDAVNAGGDLAGRSHTIAPANHMANISGSLIGVPANQGESSSITLQAVGVRHPVNGVRAAVKPRRGGDW